MWAYQRPLTLASGPVPLRFGEWGSPSSSAYRWLRRWVLTQNESGPSSAIDPAIISTPSKNRDVFKDLCAA
jgi:hypothetical protein